jgi:hypothetical protein
MANPHARLQALYFPLVHWISQFFGGSANAGRWGRYSRLIRTTGVLISTTAALIAAGLLGFSAFWSGGSVLPLWAMVIIGLGVGINMLGLPIGWAANHLKIEQRYRYQIELHAEMNDLREKPIDLPHGSKWKWAVNGLRGVHDLNGVGGTLISWVGSGWWGLALIGATAAMDPVLASMLFVVSRVSALVSAFGAWGTNQARLNESEYSLNRQINNYYSLKSGLDDKRHLALSNALNVIFTELGANTQDKYTAWVRFHAYKALDKALGSERLITDQLKKDLKDALQPSLLPNGKFDRDKLRKLANPPVCALDGLPLLEATLYDALTASAANTQEAALVVEQFSASLNTKDQSTGRMLRFHLTHELRQHPGEVNKDALLNSAKNSGLFNPETGELDLDSVQESNKVQTPHGSQVARTHYTEQVARAVVLRSLGSR